MNQVFGYISIVLALGLISVGRLMGAATTATGDSGSSQVEAPWMAELKGELGVLLVSGQLIKGTYRGLTENGVKILQSIAGGEIEMEVRLSQIKEISFPGDGVLEEALKFAEAGQHAEALVRLDALFRQRLALFPVLPESELILFLQAPLSALQLGQPSRAAAFSRELRQYLSNPDAIATLRDCELLAIYQLQILSEAAPMAQEWVDNEEAYSSSALGYMVLAGVEFLRGDYEKALWISLIPCVYSSGASMTYLNGCYSIAVASAHGLEDPGQRDILLAEMESRGLSWLDLRIFKAAPFDMAEVPRPATGSVAEPEIDPLEPLLDPAAEIAKLDAMKKENASGGSGIAGEPVMPGEWMPKPRLPIR